MELQRKVVNPLTIDETVFRHDLTYDAFPDTKTRNVMDKVMAYELDEILNPTLRERVERAVIKPIIKKIKQIPVSD